MQQIKPNQEKPIDLVKDFYDQDIDHKALEKALTQRKNTAKGFTNFSLDTYTGEFGDAEKKHLLNRTMVGYCHRHHKDLDSLSLDQAVDLVLSKDIYQEPRNIWFWETSFEQYKQKYDADDVGPNEQWVNRPYNKEFAPGGLEANGHERRESIYASLIYSMNEQATSIHWKLFLFLHNLTPVKGFVGGGHKAAYNYIKLLFNSSFDSYKTFIYNLTLDSSMLSYLNLTLSKKETPDENFAREIQELFTVGKRPFAKFSEQDVREIARALVGWKINYPEMHNEGHEMPAIFDASNHDIEDKYFSSFYGNKVIKGREGESGAEELQEVVDMLFETDENAIYIARRLYQFFVYPVLTEEIEEKIIQPLARIYKDNNYSLVEPLRVLLKSQHFFENQIENSLIKSPIDFFMGFIKEFDLKSNRVLHHYDGNQIYKSLFEPYLYNDKVRDTSYIEYRFIDQIINWYLDPLGYTTLKPPSVSGWPAYYQEPVFDLFWINSSTLPLRIDAVKRYIRSGIPTFVYIDNEYGVESRYNLIDYLRSFDDPYNYESFLDELIFRFIGGQPPNNLKEKINQIILNNVNEVHWEEEIKEIIDNPGSNKDSYWNVEWKLGQAIELMSSTGEFQLF